MALLISVLGVQATRLLEETRELAIVQEAAARGASRPLVARLSAAGDRFDLDLTGPPHGAVLILAERLEPLLVELDAHGRGSARGLRLPDGAEALRVLPVDTEQMAVVSVPSRTPTPTHIPTMTPPPPTSTPTRTLSPTPHVVPSPTPTASPSPAPTASPSPAREPASMPRPATPTGAAPATSSPTSTPPVRARQGPPARGAPPVLNLIADAGSRLALTFDGGDAANGTDELLDLLDRLHLRVTLFVTGEFIEQHPALVRRAVLTGHEIGNHTYSHPHLTSYASNHRHQLLDQVNRDWLQEELRRTEEAFVRATGRRMAPLWRAPYGEENAALRAWALELGYLHVRWSSVGGASLDSLDWVNDEHSAMYRDSDRIIARLLRFPRLAGGIVLMHLSSERELPPWRELPRLLDRLRARGLEVVTVGELLEGSPTWHPWLERARENHRASFAGDPTSSQP